MIAWTKKTTEVIFQRATPMVDDFIIFFMCNCIDFVQMYLSSKCFIIFHPCQKAMLAPSRGLKLFKPPTFPVSGMWVPSNHSGNHAAKQGMFNAPCLPILKFCTTPPYNRVMLSWMDCKQTLGFLDIFSLVGIRWVWFAIYRICIYIYLSIISN